MLRPGLERSFGKLSDTSEVSESSSRDEKEEPEKDKAEVEAADASEFVPTVTEIKQMHEAEEEEKAEKKPSDPAVKKDVETKTADSKAADSTTATEGAKPPDPTDDKLETKSKGTKVGSETKGKADKKSALKSATKASAKSDKVAAEPKKGDPKKAEVAKADKPAKAETKETAPESDSDSDSDIIVTSSEPMTIEKLTASMNLSRSVSAASAATTSSKKSVRFSEGTKGSSEESLVKPPEPEKKAEKPEPAQEEEEDKEAALYPNPYVEGFDRTGFLRKRLYGKRDEWTTRRPVSIRIATYNVNDRVPPSGTKELGPLVGHGHEDIIVVGLQEADLRSSSMLVAQGGDRAAAWEEAIFAGFGDNHDLYEKVELVQYVGVALFVFARSEIRTEIRRCETSSRGIGLLGFGGNKAGVAARMKIFDTTVCFVCSRELSGEGFD